MKKIGHTRIRALIIDGLEEGNTRRELAHMLWEAMSKKERKDNIEWAVGAIREDDAED